MSITGLTIIGESINDSVPSMDGLWEKRSYLRYRRVGKISSRKRRLLHRRQCRHTYSRINGGIL